MLRKIVASIGFLTIIIVLAFSHTQSAEALSCIQPDPVQTFVANGGIVFVGVTTQNASSGTTFEFDTAVDRRQVTFNVSQAWSSDNKISSPFTIFDHVPLVSGLPPYGDDQDPWGFRKTFEVDKQYIVYASFENGEWRANIGGCDRSQESNQHAVNNLMADLGSSYTPAGSSTGGQETGGSFQDTLLQQIQNLLALVASLQAQLANLGGGNNNTAVVTDFQSCVAVIGVVQESYPRKCTYIGQTYVEDISNYQVPQAHYMTCPTLTRDLYVGLRGDDVEELQLFLQAQGTYTYPTITGYFGSATQSALQQWQAQNGVVSSGSPATTGYGVVGPATRAAIQRICRIEINTDIFNASVTRGSAPLRVQFTSPYHATNDSTEPQHYVDFGDGTSRERITCVSSTGNDLGSYHCSRWGVNHTYTTNGTYTATLIRETDPCGGLRTCLAGVQSQILSKIQIDVGSDQPTLCTLQYDPVCGQKQVQCITTPCYPVQTTYGNLCQLRADNATYLYNGQCRDENPTTAPDSCRIWNDGCNTCSRSYPGGPLICTLRACFQQGTPKCEAYFSDTTGGTAPVIHSFTGPTVLGSNETGVWEIKASDPQNGTLSYKVDWGETRFGTSFDTIAALASSGFVQNTTFTHSYTLAGTYTVTITVRDQQGLQTQTSSTVQVGGTEAQEGFSVTPNSGTAPLNVTATITLSPRPSFDLVEVCGPIEVGTVNWGDGTSSRPTRLGCSSQRIVTVPHTYQNAGTYSIEFKRTDNARFVSTVTVRSDVITANFSGTPTTGTAPLSVHFTGRVNSAGYSVDFGDGSTSGDINCSHGGCPTTPTSSTVNVTHTYGSPGTYTAKLREHYAYNKGNCTGANCNVVGTMAVTVSAAPTYYQPTCLGGSTYGAGFYEQCDSVNTSLSVFQPSGGFYNMGDDIQVRWTSNVQSDSAGMYLVLEDEVTGQRYKSMKVDRGTGQAIFNTGSSCNGFFSDGIYGDCANLRGNIFKGNVRYRIRAVIYTPKDACFGFCAPGSTSPTTIIESYSPSFTLSS